MTTAVITTRPDVDRLLAPIAGDKRAGESVRFDAVYDEIKKRREEDDPTLPLGVWKRELKRADWPGVAELCANTLATRSKDLQLGAWLTEAWIHLYGFAGLEGGLRLLGALCREFWDDVYPLVVDGDVSARMAPIGWTAEKLALPVKSIPVTAPTTEDTVPYGWKDWETGLYVANLDAAAAAKAQERGMVPQSKFMVSVSLTPGAWYAALAHEVAAASAALDALEQVLIEKAGDANVPSIASMRAPLAAIQTFVARVVGERVQKGELAPAVVAETKSVAADGTVIEAEAATSEEALTTSAGPIGTRADAFRRLSEAAEYLMRSEPHSPVPYLVLRAVAWGNLSLAELLKELLEKNTDLNAIYTLLGMKRS